MAESAQPGSADQADVWNQERADHTPKQNPAGQGDERHDRFALAGELGSGLFCSAWLISC